MCLTYTRCVDYSNRTHSMPLIDPHIWKKRLKELQNEQIRILWLGSDLLLVCWFSNSSGSVGLLVTPNHHWAWCYFSQNLIPSKQFNWIVCVFSNVQILPTPTEILINIKKIISFNDIKSKWCNLQAYKSFSIKIWIQLWN